ncbi:unnamed protein product [Phaedon cochleariae]|uniref:Mediator of RNA polymerase II transcription subunit 13 n=1 Tax=Phaedon cochleariae TaxID=80249 RepID=A0A9N9SB91_PHACE|nr:unnamed protein product [Phaedon cochleariae]
MGFILLLNFFFFHFYRFQSLQHWSTSPLCVKNPSFPLQTELSGIKWRKLVWTETDRTGVGGGGIHHPHHHSSPEPLDDPVLRSYARCLAADILSVWRRVSTTRATANAAADVFDMGPPPPAQPPPLSLAASKELWIFWYGEEPDLNELVAPELNMSVGIDLDSPERCDIGKMGENVEIGKRAARNRGSWAANGGFTAARRRHSFVY